MVLEFNAGEVYFATNTDAVPICEGKGFNRLLLKKYSRFWDIKLELILNLIIRELGIRIPIILDPRSLKEKLPHVKLTLEK